MYVCMYVHVCMYTENIRVVLLMSYLKIAGVLKWRWGGGGKLQVSLYFPEKNWHIRMLYI